MSRHVLSKGPSLKQMHLQDQCCLDKLVVLQSSENHFSPRTTIIMYKAKSAINLAARLGARVEAVPKNTQHVDSSSIQSMVASYSPYCSLDRSRIFRDISHTCSMCEWIPFHQRPIGPPVEQRPRAHNTPSHYKDVAKKLVHEAQSTSMEYGIVAFSQHLLPSWQDSPPLPRGFT